MDVHRLLHLTVTVLLGAIILRYLVGWWNSSSEFSSSLSTKDLISHVPIHRDLAAFVEDFDGPSGQRIVEVCACTQTLPVRHAMHPIEPL